MQTLHLNFQNLEQIDQFCQEFTPKIKNGATIFLSGTLGAGKTTFTKYIAQHLGLDQNRISSPTYAYINTFPISNNQKLIHIDLYRLEQLDHNLLMEIEEFQSNPHNIILIEWPERLNEALIADYHLHLTRNPQSSPQ